MEDIEEVFYPWQVIKLRGSDEITLDMMDKETISASIQNERTMVDLAGRCIEAERDNTFERPLSLALSKALDAILMRCSLSTEPFMAVSSPPGRRNEDSDRCVLSI